MRWLILILLFNLLLSSCGPSEEEINTEALKVFQRRVAELQSQKDKECQQEALRLAETKVDSIIAQRADNPIKDPLYRPNVPTRPEFVPIDSNMLNSKHSVKPIIKQQ